MIGCAVVSWHVPISPSKNGSPPGHRLGHHGRSRVRIATHQSPLLLDDNDDEKEETEREEEDLAPCLPKQATQLASYATLHHDNLGS